MDKPDYRGWKIKKVGGFITIAHYWATKDDQSFWAFKLKDLKAQIDSLEAGDMTFEDINIVFRNPLYR